MLTQEFIFEKGPTPSCHASTLCVAGNGAVLAAWFGGKEEGADDVSIWLARREVDKWSAPQKVGSGSGTPCWNPVLFRTRRGTTLLFYKVGTSPQTWSGVLRRSEDDGKTWSEPALLPPGILGPIKNKPLELGDGTLVCGTSVESYKSWGCWVERTPDEGRTWAKHGPILVPAAPYGAIQPSIFGSGDGKLAMLCRTRDLHQMIRAESRDGGRTWSPAEPISLPQNNAGLDATRLKDGRVILIYNHSTGPRTPLNLAVSSDLGRTWTPGPVLETERGEYSYPCIIQAPDDLIHFAYTWRRERIRYGSLSPSELPKG